MTPQPDETPSDALRAALRALPSVDRLAVSVARAALAERRAELLAGTAEDTNDEPGRGEDADLVQSALERLRPSLRRVINATGVVIHTNLGRAPLSRAARDAVARTAAGYSNLELDLRRGERGTRHDHVEHLLRELTGAEAAIVVNNGAAAVLLAAAALAGSGRELIVSRGQLIEIGGGFRIPDVVAQAGSRLVEVGTTNRTRLEDYRAALGPATGALLRVHASNFRTIGFVEQVDIEPLCSLGPPVIDDVGSGALTDAPAAVAEEPAVRRSVAAGAALVCFSGDKLLGGPQAGIMAGRRAAVDAARRHPLARALRIDKLSLAALEATLALYREPAMAVAEIPVLAMLNAPQTVLNRRARSLADAVDGEIVSGTARVGGGALPLLELPGPVVRVAAGRGGAGELARRLRGGDPPVVARVQHDEVLLDPRTLSDAEVPEVVAAVRAAMA
jgi:L-seryl-tRNA(Ser) seleniumtransferase